MQETRLMITCKDFKCELRIKCAIAHKQIEGKTIIYKGYVDKICKYFKLIKKEVKK